MIDPDKTDEEPLALRLVRAVLSPSNNHSEFVVEDPDGNRRKIELQTSSARATGLSKAWWSAIEGEVAYQQKQGVNF